MWTPRRRTFLRAMAVAPFAATWAEGQTSPPTPSAQTEERHTMFYQPSLLRVADRRYSAWSHSIVDVGGKLVNAVAVQEFTDPPSAMGLAVSESVDGVHWRETHPFTCPLERGVAGYCLRWTGSEFIYYCTEVNTGDDRAAYPIVLRQYRSPDLQTLECMGDAYTTRPDKQWYKSRWDELVVLEGGGGFYGYITSEPHPHLAVDSLGMLRSDDGLHWEILPPPAFDWAGLPPQQMEVCFCIKAGGRYFLGMGSRCYLGHLGYSVVVFVGDSPRGPFRADREAFRLCGSTRRDVSWLVKAFCWKGETLLSDWYTTQLDRSYPGIFGNGRTLYIGPVKAPVVDADGHLRMAYWPGNDAAKGVPVALDPKDLEVVHPATEYRTDRFRAAIGDEGAFTLEGGYDGAIALLPGCNDLARGVILEGALAAVEPRGYVGTHWHPAAAGFYFEDSPGAGMLMQLETLGLTRTGRFEYAAAPAFDADEYKLAAWGNMGRGGRYLGLSRFTEEDVVGPTGYAPPGGIRNGVTHRFRLLAKSGLMELYLDDLLVQTYITGSASGRLGLFAKSGPVTYSDLRAWTMT